MICGLVTAMHCLTRVGFTDDDFEDDMDESGDGKGEMLDLEAIAREGFGEDSESMTGMIFFHTIPCSSIQ